VGGKNGYSLVFCVVLGWSASDPSTVDYAAFNGDMGNFGGFGNYYW